MVDHPFELLASGYGPIEAVEKDSGAVWYLGASTQNYTPLKKKKEEATQCMWLWDKEGLLWLCASLTVYRYLGEADGAYADWGIGTKGSNYSAPLLYNADGTVNLYYQPTYKLYNDGGWAKWSLGTPEKTLIITPAPPPRP